MTRRRLSNPVFAVLAISSTISACATSVPGSSRSPLVIDLPHPAETPSAHTIDGHDGSFSITTAVRWKVIRADGAALFAFSAGQTLAVRHGDADGGITTCDRSAGWWERCHRVNALALDELVRAFEPSNYAFARSPAILDGELAAVLAIPGSDDVRIGPFVTYVLVMHDQRPYAIRVWTDRPTGIAGLDELIAGFRFRAPQGRGGARDGRPTEDRTG